MNESQYYFKVFGALIRLFGVIYCSVKAGNLNRNQWGWGLFGLFLPVPAIITMQFLKPRINESSPEIKIDKSDNLEFSNKSINPQNEAAPPLKTLETKHNEIFNNKPLLIETVSTEDKTPFKIDVPSKSEPLQTFSFALGFVSSAVMLMIIYFIFSENFPEQKNEAVTDSVESNIEPTNSLVNTAGELFLGHNVYIINDALDTVSLKSHFSLHKEEYGSFSNTRYSFLDFNNDGIAELLTELYYGGAHCCTRYQIYKQVQPNLFRSVFDFPGAASDGLSINHEYIYANMYEQIGYFFSCYACGLQEKLPHGYFQPTLMFEYEKDTVVRKKDQARYMSEIIDNLTFLKNRGIPTRDSNMGFDDGTRKAFAAHILRYHYSGEYSIEHTEAFFRDFYLSYDADEVWSQIESLISEYNY